MEIELKLKVVKAHPQNPLASTYLRMVDTVSAAKAETCGKCDFDKEAWLEIKASGWMSDNDK